LLDYLTLLVNSKLYESTKKSLPEGNNITSKFQDLSLFKGDREEDNGKDILGKLF
jgi:hypothetical protein